MIQTTLDMFRKTPEEVARGRHAPDVVKPHDELSEKQKEQHAKLNMLWIAFFQDNGIPLSAMNSRSFEVMIEAIAQYGPGFVCPSQEELRGPLFEEVMKGVDELREKHEKAWNVTVARSWWIPILIVGGISTCSVSWWLVWREFSFWDLLMLHIKQMIQIP